MSDWRERIVLDPSIKRGRPVVKGTRLTVEFVLGELADGMTVEELLEEYPRLTQADVQACLAYAVDSITHHAVFPA